MLLSNTLDAAQRTAAPVDGKAPALAP
jgi:hypothetical protein